MNIIKNNLKGEIYFKKQLKGEKWMLIINYIFNYKFN